MKKNELLVVVYSGSGVVGAVTVINGPSMISTEVASVMNEVVVVLLNWQKTQKDVL